MQYHVMFAPDHNVPPIADDDEIKSVRQRDNGALVIDCNSGLKVVAAPHAWSWYREVPEGYGE